MNKPWYEYTDPKNRFSVSFPDVPNINDTETQHAGEEEFTLETIISQEDKNKTMREYSIFIANIPALAQLQTTRKEYYNSLAKGMMEEKGKTIFLQGLSAVEVRYREQNTYIRKIRIADKDFKLIYMLSVAGTEVFVNSPDVKRFIESFRFTS